MKWEKLGRLFVAEGQREWMKSHSAMPRVLHLSGNKWRVFFGTRNNNNQPHIGFVEFDIDDPTNVTRIPEDYVLGPGQMGFFDDNGLYPGSILIRDTQILMYYMGRSNGIDPLYYMAIGLAQSDDNGETFKRFSPAPIMERSKYDPWMVSTPWVMEENGRFRMWYLSGLGWKEVGNNPKSLYHIKYAESYDGINWQRKGHIAIDLRPEETNIAAPSVIKCRNMYEMWYSFVADRGYELGYAVSEDGFAWTRKDDQVGISLSSHGWDSESMAYPCVFVHENRKYLIYSGNGNGRDGIGLAVQV